MYIYTYSLEMDEQGGSKTIYNVASLYVVAASKAREYELNKIRKHWTRRW